MASQPDRSPELRRQQAERWVRYMGQAVVPLILRTIESPVGVMHDVGDITVKGSQKVVWISWVTPKSGWVWALLRALQQTRAASYTVRVFGVTIPPVAYGTPLGEDDLDYTELSTTGFLRNAKAFASVQDGDFYYLVTVQP